GHLQRANFSVPQRMKTVATGTPHIAVYIWPDCEHEGTLETLCLESVRRDPARDCVESYFACLEEQLDALPKAIHKAQLHAFLASRERPDLRLGEAARKGYWPWDHPVFNALKDFLRAL
ncbi:MAG: hypothetical protein JXA10_15015, partial [Anaerolineae bacterium]|nr:hypothetical protein [Anaerolineae bacterium]